VTAEIAIACGMGAWLALITGWFIQQNRKFVDTTCDSVPEEIQ
jgi:hypothetical protein